MNNFTNMKIAVTADQPLEDIVVELERLGFHCLAIEKYKHWLGANVKTMIATTFIYEKTLPEFHWTLTTLAELKEM